MSNLETLAELLTPTEVMLNLRVGSKAALLGELAKRAAKLTGVAAPALSAALVAREELGSTGFGSGIAVPHARLDGLTRVFCLIAVLEKPVPYNAVDGQPVDIAFLLISPKAANSAHLAILAAATRKLRNAEISAAIRASTSAEQVIAALI